MKNPEETTELAPGARARSSLALRAKRLESMADAAERGDQAGAALRNLDELICVALEQERVWVSNGESVSTPTPDVKAAVAALSKAFDIASRSSLGARGAGRSLGRAIRSAIKHDPDLREEIRAALDEEQEDECI